MDLDDTLPIGPSGATDPAEDSVIGLVRKLQTDRDEAAQLLWNRYFQDLVLVAKRMLQGAPKGMADEEDVAVSVFRSICQGGEEGRFHDLQNRDELWWLLLALTRQKASTYVRNEKRQKRGDGEVRREADLVGSDAVAGFSLENLIGTTPTPEFLVQMQEEHQILMDLLGRDDLRQVAALRIAGYEVTEIAQRLDLCSRSVLRKLALVRKIWNKQLEDSTVTNAAQTK